MEEPKWTAKIWKFNAYVIAVAGILATGVLSFGSYVIYKEITEHQDRSQIVNIDPETEIEEKFELGRLDRIAGTNSVVVPLHSEQEFDLQFSGKRSRSVRNLMFSNMKVKSNHWLLKTNDNLIAHHHMIRKAYDGNVYTIAYEIVKSDTNKDNRLTANDLLTISLSTPEGNHHTEILKNVDDVLGYQIIDENNLAIMHTRNGKAHITYTSLKDFKITEEVEIPLPKEAP